MSAIDALPAIPFRGAVLLLPIATVLHVLDEWPEFPRWARRFASPRYSDREYVRTHILAVAISLLSALLVCGFPTPVPTFAFFALVLGPNVFCNALFHCAATLLSGERCAGMLSGLLLYLPLSVALAGLALRDGVLTPLALIVTVAIAAAFHALEVGHNVFKRW